MTEKTSKFSTVLLTPQQVLNVWPSIEADVDKALSHGIDEMSVFDLFKDAINGTVFVWITLDRDNRIVCTTTLRFLAHKNVKTCQIITNTTNGVPLKQVEADHRLFEDFAKKNGCSHMQVWGRKGWQRRLQTLSSRQGNKYKTQYYVFDMEIQMKLNLFMPYKHLHPRASGLIAFKGGGGGASAAEVNAAATSTQNVVTEGFTAQNEAQATALGTPSGTTTGAGGTFVTPTVTNQSIGADGRIINTTTGGDTVAFGGNTTNTAGTVFGNQEQIIGQNDDTQSLINQRFDTFQPATVVQQSIDTSNLAKSAAMDTGFATSAANQGLILDGQKGYLQGQADIKGNQTDILGNQTAMQTGIDSANTALGTVQTGVDTANTNIGNLGSDVAGVQSSVDTGFAAQGTQMTDLQAAVLGGQATMSDVLAGMRDEATTYYGDLSAGQTNIQDSVGGVQTGLDTLRKDQAQSNTLADQARAELASTVTGGFDAVTDNQAELEKQASKSAQRSQINQANIANQSAATADQVVGGFAETARQIASNNAPANEQQSSQQQDFVQRLSTIKQILSTQGDQLDESVRSEYSTLANAFDNQGKLIADSVDANGSQVRRGLDQQGMLVTNTYDRQGELSSQTNTNITQLMQAMDSIGYRQQGSQLGDLSSNGIGLMSQQQSGPFIQQSMN